MLGLATPRESIYERSPEAVRSSTLSRPCIGMFRRNRARSWRLVAAGALFVATRSVEVAAEEARAPIDVIARGSSEKGFSTRVSVDDRAREPIDAASVLAELPSVHVRRVGADGSQSLLSIRGSASTQVGVVFAGIPLTSGADPSFDFGSLPLFPGASFRVYRGFAPATLGTTGYLGGLVVIDPPSPLFGARTESQLLAGSFGSLKARAGDTRVIGKLKLGLFVFGARADNDFSFEAKDARTNRLKTQRRTNAGYVSAGGVARASLERSWGTIGATLLADARQVGLPGSTNFPTTFPRLETGRFIAGLDATIRAPNHGFFRAVAWGRDESSLFSDPRAELDPTRTALFNEQRLRSAGGSFGYRFAPSRRASLNVALDARFEHLSPSFGQSSFGSVSASRLAGGLGLEYDLRASEPLRLSASARLDARHDQASGIATSSNVMTSNDLVPSAHIGASYRFADAALASAHAGLLRRFPGFVELYGDRGSLVGDPNLRVERALSADLGVSGELSTRGVAFHYEVVLFATSARDLIVFLPLGRSTFRASNVERALLGGLEVSASLTARGLHTTLSYTLLGTENQSDEPLARGRPLPGRPVHDLSYDASYRFGPLGLRYGVDAIAGNIVDTSGTILLPPRFFHSAGVALDVPGLSWLRLALEVQNLLDIRSLYVPSALLGRSVAVPVSDFLGFPLPGRTFWFSARVRLR